MLLALMLLALGIGEALGAVAALQQETLAGGDAAERLLQIARLAGKHQRRIARKLLLDRRQAPSGPGTPAPGRSACLRQLSRVHRSAMTQAPPLFEFPVVWAMNFDGLIHEPARGG